MSIIEVLFTEDEQQKLRPGRYYIGVRVKIPTVIIVDSGDELPVIEPSLDSQNSAAHSNSRVALSETRFMIFDITAHGDCPTEQTVKAADEFLGKHYRELDYALRAYLRDQQD